MSQQKTEAVLYSSLANSQPNEDQVVHLPKNTEKCPGTGSGNTKAKLKNNLKLMKFVIVILVVLLIILLIVTIVIAKFTCVKSTNINTTTMSSLTTERSLISNAYWNDYRLPDTYSSIKYDITFQIFINHLEIGNMNLVDKFHGKVIIHFNLTKQSNFIVLHYKNINITNVEVYNHLNTNLQTNITQYLVETLYYEPYHYWILIFNRTIPVSQYIIKVTYMGEITSLNSGILKTFYNDVKANKSYIIIYTKLEPRGARSVFPCFDEPDKKALFRITVIHEEDKIVLSNMPIAGNKTVLRHQLISNSNINLGHLKITSFNYTFIPMSTYLVAFVILSNYKSMERERKPGYKVRIWYPSFVENSIKIPLKFAAESENFLEDYFNLSSPMKKSDHVYTPNFLSGAMENWGLVTYRDGQLLVPDSMSNSDSLIQLNTIAHEVAHTWFGNWLTTKWWSELWINEGFATYFATYAYRQVVNLSVRLRDQWLIYKNRDILKHDIYDKKPIILNVTLPDQYGTVFNSFTYYKGKAILMWLESIMGPTSFNIALKDYLFQYKTKNPTSDQFFTVMDKYGASHLSVNIPSLKSLFMPWLNKSSFPILKVNYDITKKRMLLSQTPFNKYAPHTDRWPIYTTYITKSNPNDTPIYFDDMYSFNINLKSNSYIIVNSNGYSYLRVRYSDYLFDKIIANLKTDNINAISKGVIFDDYLYFMYSYSLNVSKAKQLIDTLENDSNYITWISFFSTFTKFYKLYRHDVKFIKFRNYMIKLSKYSLDFILKSDLNQTDPIEQNFRKIIILINCMIDNPVAKKWVSDQFLLWIKRSDKVMMPKYLAKTILYFGMQANDNYKFWNKTWNLLHTRPKNYPLTSLQLLNGLVGTRKPYLIEKVLNLYLKPISHISSTTKKDELFEITHEIINTNSGRHVFKRWIIKNYLKLIKNGFSVYNQRVHKHLISLCHYEIDVQFVKIFTPLLSGQADRCSDAVKDNNRWKENVGSTFLELL